LRQRVHCAIDDPDSVSVSPPAAGVGQRGLAVGGGVGLAVGGGLGLAVSPSVAESASVASVTVSV
jgi:hypothetical protein